MKRCFVGVLMVAAVLAAWPVHALQLGDPAPKLDISAWVKGEPVTSLDDPKKVFVVELWATWCGPCKESIPHLTELQRKYKDRGLEIIGISTEDKATVEEFLKSMGDKMDYRVALDTDGITSEAYSKPFDVRGIPHAFVVALGGKLLWHGHPMSGLDKMVASVIDGNFDEKKVMASISQSQNQQEIDQLSRLWGQEYLVFSKSGRDKAGADAVGQKLLEYPGVSPMWLNALAMEILKDTTLAYRNMDYVVKCSEEACKRVEFKDAAVMDTHGWALFKAGKVKEGQEMLKRALSVAENDQERTAITNHLKQAGVTDVPARK